jgi:beta-lactamase class A
MKKNTKLILAMIISVLIGICLETMFIVSFARYINTNTSSVIEKTTDTYPPIITIPKEDPTITVTSPTIATEDKSSPIVKPTEKSSVAPTSPTSNKLIRGPVSITNIKDTDTTVYGYGNIKKPEKLDELETILDTYVPEISVVAISLNNNRAISYNTNEDYFSACTIKMGYVLNCCKIIEERNIDINTTMIYEEEHYHGGSGDIRYQPYGTEYTLKELITKCLHISDNVAYEMLLDYFGLSEYNQMVSELGCDSLYLDGMWTTATQAKDLAIVWKEVDNYFNTGSEMSKVLKDACTNSPFNYGTLEIEEDYSHKSGDNTGTFAAYNDAGIVWDKNSPYIYVVLTDSEGTWQDATTVNSAMNLIYDIMTD